jgi:hypothetical protein
MEIMVDGVNASTLHVRTLYVLSMATRKRFSSAPQCPPCLRPEDLRKLSGPTESIIARSAHTDVETNTASNQCTSLSNRPRKILSGRVAIRKDTVEDVRLSATPRTTLKESTRRTDIINNMSIANRIQSVCVQSLDAIMRLAGASGSRRRKVPTFCTSQIEGTSSSKSSCS